MNYYDYLICDMRYIYFFMYLTNKTDDAYSSKTAKVGNQVKDKKRKHFDVIHRAQLTKYIFLLV